MKVGFIGFGRMGSALASGIIDAGVANAEDVVVSDVDGDARKRAVELRVDVAKNNVDLIRQCDVIFLCVKPNKIGEVLKEVGSKTRGKTLVSIAAGVTLKSLESKTKGARVIRVMPNTPALIGEGASAYCLGKNAGDNDAEIVEKMLQSIGVCVRVKEEEMNAVTGVSGSGPAYVYAFIQSLINGGVKAGLNDEAAKKLAVQTVVGAAKMVRDTAKSPRELIEMVKSPGGTTEQGLKVLEEKKFSEIIEKTVEAAAKKAAELSAK